MKKFLNLLLTTALSTSTIPATLNVTNKAATRATFADRMPVEEETKKSKKIKPDPDGINLIDSSYHGFYFFYDVYINSSKLEEWKEYATDLNTLKNTIARDIDEFKAIGLEYFINSVGIANQLAKNFSLLINTSGSGMYGVVVTFIDRMITWWYSIECVKPQFSLDSHNSSYIQEDFSSLSHNKLNIYISREQWEKMLNAGKDPSKIIAILYTFPQDPAWNKIKIDYKSISTMARVITHRYDIIDCRFEESPSHGWIVKTNTLGEWLGCYSQ